MVFILWMHGIFRASSHLFQVLGFLVANRIVELEYHSMASPNIRPHRPLFAQ